MFRRGDVRNGRIEFIGKLENQDCLNHLPEVSHPRDLLCNATIWHTIAYLLSLLYREKSINVQLGENFIP